MDWKKDNKAELKKTPPKISELMFLTVTFSILTSLKFSLIEWKLKKKSTPKKALLPRKVTFSISKLFNMKLAVWALTKK